ncbi:MAG: type II CAAX endopeptidase family protein [Clostridia bacterium]|nr:type II CAAX endopeptidase family protein [Clostridia bacterium]
MEKRAYYDEKAFPIVFFVSFYLILLASMFITKITASADVVSYISFAIPQLIYISVTLIYSRATNTALLKAVPIRVKMKPSLYLWSAAATVGLFCFALLPNMLVMLLLNAIGLRTTVSVPALGNAASVLLSLAIICILPAIGEELVFRGVLASSFKNYGGAAIVFISGLLFSLSHFNTAQTVYQFFIGILLAYLFLKTDNLLIAVLIHFFNNAIAVFLPSIIPFFASIALTGINILVLSIMCVFGLFLLVFSIRKLTAPRRASDAIKVFEYQPDSGEFVAVASEKKHRSRGAKRLLADVKATFFAIISTFKKGELSRRKKAFDSLFPARRKLGAVIKIMIAVIIGLWLITILL